MTLPCSHLVKRLRACSDVIYAAGAKLHKGLPKLSVYYVAPGNPSQTALDPQRKKSIDRLQKTGWFEHVDMQAVGSTELRELFLQAHDAVKATFDARKYLPLPGMSGVDQAYLAVVEAREFVDKVLTNEIGHIRRTLFHDNVRGYLQLTNPVNARISATLQDDERRNRFVIMNNGLTIVTRGLTLIGDRFELRDFQVVNGCQTCHVLFYERAALTGDTHVSLRIIMTQDRDTITDIVLASNRQTAVPASAFEARSAFHKQLEDYFAAQVPPRHLFYERRSGQYGTTGTISDDLIPAAANPGIGIQRTRIVSPTHLARAFAAAFLGEGWRSSGNGAMPERSIFGKTSDPLPFYTAASMLYRIEYLVRNRRIPSPYIHAKYHLIAAAKYTLVGDGPVPGAVAKRRAMCDKILDCMWNDSEAEKLFLSLTGALLEARNAERPGGSGELDATLLRSKGFSDHLRRIIMARMTKGSS